jgi:hypothetical protein
VSTSPDAIPKVGDGVWSAPSKIEFKKKNSTRAVSKTPLSRFEDEAPRFDSDSRLEWK